MSALARGLGSAGARLLPEGRIIVLVIGAIVAIEVAVMVVASWPI